MNYKTKWYGDKYTLCPLTYPWTYDLCSKRTFFCFLVRVGLNLEDKRDTSKEKYSQSSCIKSKPAIVHTVWKPRLERAVLWRRLTAIKKQTGAFYNSFYFRIVHIVQHSYFQLFLPESRLIKSRRKSVRAGSRGFPPAITNVTPRYFYEKQKKRRTRRDP